MKSNSRLIREIRKTVKTGNCKICGFDFSNYSEPKHVKLHHIIPVRFGGQDTDENLVLICSRCHGNVHSYYNLLGLEKDREFIICFNILKSKKGDLGYSYFDEIKDKIELEQWRERIILSDEKSKLSDDTKGHRKKD